MKKKNLFDLLALKEKISSNKFLQKLKPLQEEKIKVEKILVQLNELKNDKNSNLSTSAWELKSASNIQEKINQQKEIAKYKISRIEKEKKSLTKIIAKHEIKRKRSIEKSEHLKSIENLEKEKKLETDITLKNNSFRWH